jgi:FkbM family methyltransferase
MNGRLKVYEWYFDQPYLEKKALSPVWSKEMVEQLITLAKQGQLGGNYGILETNALRDGLQHAPGVKNGRVLVIGSEDPWVEACVLEAGAKEIVTLEYGEIISKHPKIKTMTPLQFRKSYLSDTLGTFDAIVTFSSVEHSGLGRYGDALNPWGDIIAIARAWCVTKQGGSLTIGVMYDYSNDCIRFNAGRWYGKVRFPYLATNWKQFYRGQGSQRVHVFTNGNVKPTLDLPMYLKPPSPYKYINNTNVKYSQAKQDQTVYDLFTKKNGFFIEIGAFDGMTLSNTLWLERHHNWTGLLIEANPDLCDAIDKRKRRAWRLCACISTESSTTFIKGGTLGSAIDSVDKDHLKLLNLALKVTVPCFKLDTVLDTIQQTHIDYFSLDVEGAELFILNSMKNELKSGKIIVDVWTIEYRVWDGRKIIVDKSKNNLEGLRNFFKDVGGYVEHSQLSNSADTSDGMALDVVFVYTKTWCQKYQTLPSGAKCYRLS